MKIGNLSYDSLSNNSGLSSAFKEQIRIDLAAEMGVKLEDVNVTFAKGADGSTVVQVVEVRDSPHGIFGSCTRYPRGLTRWAELLGRRRRRRQLVLSGGYRPPDPPPCLISKEQVLAQMV